MHVTRAAAVLALVVVGWSSAAGAEELEVDLQVKEGKPTEAAPDKPGPPFFRATALSRPGLQPKDFILKQNDVRPPLTIVAEKAVPYTESDEPMSMLILVQGNFRWMGNETYTDEADPASGAVYEGAHKGLGPAIDALVKAGPSGSRAGLLVYAEGSVAVKQPLGDASAVSAAALGAQQDYGENISKPLIVGLTEAWKLLSPESGRRKVLVVFGDGEDDKEDISAELKKVLSDLKAADVETYSVYYTAVPDDTPQGQQNMQKIGYSRPYTATSRDNFATFAGNIVELIGSKYYVDFPGDKVVFDGNEHEFQVSIAGTEADARMLTLPLVERPRPSGGIAWWMWLLLGLLVVVAIVVVVVVLKGRNAEPVPLPEVAEAPPAGPMKTIMLGVGGTEDAMPIVGWVVPLGGQNQYQTYKLLAGRTKLGSGTEAHIVVGDSFMSTEHAEIVSSPSGFVLNDLGSTNGSFKLERGEFKRITSHELVDNDVFKLGKTDFKFKSIN